MSPILIILHLAGAVTLLLWAVRMVRTGVERAFGPALERSLKGTRDNRLKAAGVGALVAIVLQSSTAVAVLAAGFAASGLMGFTTALAMLLGADLGSSLVVRILSFDLSSLIPFLLLAGSWMFMKGVRREVKQTGRILVGVALILISLGMLGEATASLRQSEVLPAVVNYLSADYVSSFALAALFTWLIHSSIAAVLLIASLAAEGLVPVGLGLALVLGANLGGAVIAAVLTRGSSPPARRVPLGNLACRGSAAVLGLVVLGIVDLPLELAGLLAGADPAEQVVMMHVAFNITILLVSLPLVGVVGAVLTRLLPDERPAGETEGLIADRVSALDRSVLDSPRMALASATRELLRMSEIIEVMLRPVMELYEMDERDRLKARVKELRQLDQEVNRVHSDIKLYLVELNRGAMSSDEAQRAMMLANFAINLEHVGDLVSKNLYKLAVERCEKRLVFSEEGWRELTDLHAQVLANIQLALNVLVSGDRESARELIGEKDRMRELELSSQNRHLRRLQGGSIESVETSEIHLETIRGLKQANSLFAAIAYPILVESGDLLESRLAQM